MHVANIRYQSLIQLGFPSDGLSRQEAMQIIQDIKLSNKTIIVIDDYHHIDKMHEEMNSRKEYNYEKRNKKYVITSYSIHYTKLYD